MTQAISKKSWIGVATEATSGTAIATPTVYVPATGDLKWKMNTEYPKEERGTRDADYEAIQTTRSGTADIKGNFYFDTTPYLFAAAFGQSVDTQPDPTNLPTVHKHTFTPVDVPPTLTIFKSGVSAVYYMAYAACNKLSLKWTADKKLFEVDSSFEGLWPQLYTGSALTPTFSAVKAMPGYAPTITINGTQSLDVEDFDIEYTQKLTLFYPIAGSPDFVTIYFGERAAKVNYTARFDTTTNFDAFRNGTQQALVLDMKGPAIGTDAGTTYYNELNVNVPTVQLDDAELDFSKDNVQVKVKGTALAASGSNLLSLWVQNTVANYTL